MNKTMIVRGALSLALLYGVYQETGWCTTLAMALMMLAFEIIGYDES